MIVHIVVAHPEPTSFTAAMAREANEALTQAGHQVVVSDLYMEGFEPAAGRHDFLSVADPERFHYQNEQLHAARNRAFAPDLQREQGRVASADMFIFVFPIWWGGVPAILKGWFDRVLAYGFAYEDGMRYDTGYFAGRTGLMGVSTGGTAHRFSEGEAYGTIEQVLWPTQHCMVEYLGLTTPEPFVAYASPRVTDDERRNYLATWREQVLDAARVQADREPVESLPTAAPSTTSWSS